MVEASLVILVLFWIIYWFILYPILIYYTIRFYQLRFTQIIRKRFYHLTLALAITSIFTISVYSPYYLLRVYFIAQNTTYKTMDLIYVPMYSGCIYSIAALLALRFWCLWFYVKWTSLVFIIYTNNF